MPQTQRSPDNANAPRRTQVVVATTVMLSFISFWRAAAIVLNDLGSSAFYAGGIAEKAIGASAPWFILFVMFFSYAVRAVYVESSAMFTRGGVYRVVKEAMGGTLAKFSVSALLFDYILTGPISGVSAGHYIMGLVVQVLKFLNFPWRPDSREANLFSAGVAAVVTLYFWRRNIRGIRESSNDSIRIMYVVTVMVIILMGWSALTLWIHPEMRRLPPSPIPKNLIFERDALGWLLNLARDRFQTITTREGMRFQLTPETGTFFGFIGVLIAFGHSILAMSGEESLAQVNRELEYPKHKNLMKAGFVIFVYSLLFTSLVSFFAYAIIPDEVRPQYHNNLISGIANYLVGPHIYKLVFEAFIVIVGSLMLSGAINTAIIGANGVLNRLSEDQVLTDWFRAPHPRFGTSYRMINMIVILQLISIFVSRGNVYVLGEAYAFGVVLSFTFNSFAMIMLRFKEKSPREWKVPINISFRGKEIPIGLGVVSIILFSVAAINLLTKQIATVGGVLLTSIFFVIFFVSEYLNKVKTGHRPYLEMDQFNLIPKEEISVSSIQVRPGNIIVLVRDYTHLEHLRKAIQDLDTKKKDLVVLTLRVLSGPDTGYQNLREQNLFTDYEQHLFSKVTKLAEKEGKHVELLVIPSSRVFDAIAITAARLQSSEIVAGRSSVMSPEQQARSLGQSWDKVILTEKPKYRVLFRVISNEGKVWVFPLGPHLPVLTGRDIELIHKLWLDLSREPGFENLHHVDIVTYALTQFQAELQGPSRENLIRRLSRR